MPRESLAELITALEAAARGILKALRAFAGTLRSQAPASPAEPLAAHFGEHERLEESKYYPPAPLQAWRPDEATLPVSYGKTRLVLLVVDPKLVHAYWEVQQEKLQEVKSRMGNPAQAVLRFHDAGGSFDVDVDLGARNWYVPLWSAGKSYSVELGLRGKDGTFARLAGSNAVVTPRSMPMAAVEERFLRVESTGEGAKVIPPPPYRKPERPHMPPQPREAFASSASAAETQALPSVGPPVAADFPMPGNAADILRRKLAELYSFRECHPEPLKPPETVRVLAGAHLEEHDAAWAESHSDLTQLVEKQQPAGLSSALLQERRR